MQSQAQPGGDDFGARPSASRKIAFDTLIVMLAFGAAKAISLVQTFIIARVFGVGSEWDAYVTANRIPELIFTLIAGGALAHAFIPIFGGFLAQGDKTGAWRTASHVINTIFLATLAVSVIAFLAAPWLVANVVASGFDEIARQQTAELMRILLLSTLIFSVSGIVMGILQSHNHFLLPALAPIMFDVGILFGVIFLMPVFGVHGIAIGAVIGAALHFGIQVPGLIRFRARWLPELGWGDPSLWQVIRLMLPRIAGLGVFSFNFIIMNNIASRLGTGSVAALDWGWRLMQIPQTLIGTAMGTVIFPTLAALSAVGNETGKRDAMSGALRFILLATIPSSIGLVVIGRPMISLLERGAFDASASALVYSTLQFFTLGLITHSLLEVIARSFYADKDTLTPLFAALGGAAINLICSFAFSGVIAAEGAGLARTVAQQLPGLHISTPPSNVGGLALANSLGVSFEVLVLLFVLRSRWHGVNESALGSTLLKSLAASLVMAVALVAVAALWDVLTPSGGFAMIVAQLVVQVALGALVFFGVAALLKMEEIDTLFALIRRRRPAGGRA
ncbi:MAG: murein biosynthesis integral membrane protein MurJ [Anaerolineae bacterium]|nr:murein biosynthesis integral membrane protein MurJ [Anaerolineae bacterium]NUQ02365.1 murein biosynthesis integral membrane protein MurJ [Anaerolineae bacterium]